MLHFKKPRSDESRGVYFWLLGERDGTDTQCCTHETNLTPCPSIHGYWTARARTERRYVPEPQLELAL